MQQHPSLHQHLPRLQWDATKMQATLTNANQAFIYVLLTNSARVTAMDGVPIAQFCKDCNQKINCINFSLKIDNIDKEILAGQMKDFQYCVLPFNGMQCRLEEILGHKSMINDKRHSIITHNLVISSEKSIKEVQEVDRTLFCTSASSKVSESVEDLPVEDLSSSVVFSLQKQQEIIENYEVYVTKLQREVGEGYRSYMFYQYAWTEAEIQEIMGKMQKYFGPIHAFIPKRRYLRFTFARNRHDYLFKNKFEGIERELLFKNNIKLQGNILNYYLISKLQLLPNQQQTGKLFLLPNNERITDMLIANNWIVVSAETYIMFVHSQRPMEYFHHEQKVYCTQLAINLKNNKVLYATDKRGLIYCFELQEVKVILKGKLNVSFVTPYSLVHLESGMAIAGIDTDQAKKTSRRSIFIIKDGKPEKKDKPLPIQTRLQVIVMQGQNKMPIKNIKLTKEKDVIACTWSNKFFLISLQGFKLIEVELASTIDKLSAIPFLFNHLNFLILLSTADIVRVGIECYGQGLGAQLCQLNSTRASDCIVINSEGSKFELYSCQGNKIDKISYLNDSKQRFLYEDSGKIVKLACNKEGLAYLLDLQHSIQLKYLQI